MWQTQKSTWRRWNGRLCLADVSQSQCAETYIKVAVATAEESTSTQRSKMEDIWNWPRDDKWLQVATTWNRIYHRRVPEICLFSLKSTRIREDRSEDSKMAPTAGSEGGYERAEMASFRAGGLALLPWTKQMLTVLWGQLRLLLQVIYYTFMSGKIHIRNPDETHHN